MHCMMLFTTMPYYLYNFHLSQTLCSDTCTSHCLKPLQQSFPFHSQNNVPMKSFRQWCCNEPLTLSCFIYVLSFITAGTHFFKKELFFEIIHASTKMPSKMSLGIKHKNNQWFYLSVKHGHFFCDRFHCQLWRRRSWYA